jgi:hypothetical protein
MKKARMKSVFIAVVLKLKLRGHLHCCLSLEKKLLERAL